MRLNRLLLTFALALSFAFASAPGARAQLGGAVPVNSQTGTSYTFVSADRGKRVTFSNASAVSVTLPQAGASFPHGWHTQALNLGAGTVTITPTTSTVNGASSLTLAQYEAADITSDGTNYTAVKSIPSASGGTLADDSVTNAKLANMATQTFKGRTTAGTGDPEDLTATQATAMLNAVVGDSGSGGTKGLVPPPASGDAAALKFLKADGTWAVPPGSGITASSTDTLTNKTFDAEGTGNSVTIPVKVWLPAAGCNNATAGPIWDLPTSTAASAACVTGTNTQKGVLDFADTSGGFSAQNTLILPADFTGNIDARIIWTTTATSGNAKWSLSTICTDVAASATDDPAFNTASTVTTAAPGTANRVQTSSISSVTITGCSAGNLLHLKIFRDGNDGSDTIAATARLIGIELTIRRAM